MIMTASSLVEYQPASIYEEDIQAQKRMEHNTVKKVMKRMKALRMRNFQNFVDTLIHKV